MSDKPVIELWRVARRFGDVAAVDDLDLAVPAGEIVALLGPSGCGKTTTLRLIAGFERPDGGTVRIAGRTVACGGLWVPPERRDVGMVFQDYALFPHLDVAGNVAYGLSSSWGRRGRGERRRRVRETLELVGLAGLEDRHPHQLSGGQQQRVALARALAPSPAVVLLDEPFSNLDAGLRAEVRAEVTRILREAGTTAVFVTHDQEEALSIADSVAVLRDGRLAQAASPEALYHAPADRDTACFVGDADFLPGHGRDGVADTELGALRLASPVDGDLEVLLRPEDLRLAADPDGEAEVVGREFFGHDQLLTLRMDGGRVLRARLGSVSHLDLGDRCRIVVDRPVQAYPAHAGHEAGAVGR